MKKSLLLCMLLSIGFGSMAQVAKRLPSGFRQAHVPAALKNQAIKKSSLRAIDNERGLPLNSQALPRIAAATNQSADSEIVMGCTYYDLQTNNSISNRLVVNDDGTICAAWTFSPDAIQVTIPPFPSRGSGYNYYSDPSGNGQHNNLGNWLNGACPTSRTEAVRTGFTNIAVTSSGAEMTIAHNAVGTTDSNQIVINWRATKGTGAWTLMYPWGHSFDTWPKAVAAGHNVYCVFQGSGASASTTAPPHIVHGQNGPIFFSKSSDDGQNWTPKYIIPQIDSSHYIGFGGDSYSIDAKDSIVAISYGDQTTDVGLLKSSDYGNTWTQYIIQKAAMPMYNSTADTVLTDSNHDGIPDTNAVFGSSGDSKVLIDNNGMCHVWFSRYDWLNDSIGDGTYSVFDGSDELEYWNENMGQDSMFVTIATAQDFNGNDTIDIPVDTFTNCTKRKPWGFYGGGITQMPSAGIDANGVIYLTYQTIDEYPEGDTSFYHACHRHVYMSTLVPPYDVNSVGWTYPYDIVPNSTTDGGSGFDQEAVFACTGRNVANGKAYVLYQRDNAPGHALASDGTCDKLKNFGFSSDIVVTWVEMATVGILTDNSNELFVSQNYPNPATSVSYINIGLKKASDVKLEIYDIVGKLVYTETKDLSPAGSLTMKLNTSNIHSGVYTYAVTACGQRATRQMIVQ